MYAYDASETRRRAIAKRLVDNVWNVGGGILTLQNLSEFFFALHALAQVPGVEVQVLRIDRNAETVMKAMEISKVSVRRFGTLSLRHACSNMALKL